jgi:tetratricopeptide (TPR) repeat protein
MAKTLTPLHIQTLKQAYAVLQSGDAATAEAKVRFVLSSAGEHPDALNLLGLILAEQNKFEAARNALETALKIAPKNPALWNSLGNLLGDMGEVDSAFAAFEKALALDPQYTDGWINFGITAFKAHRLESAERAFAMVVVQQPNNEKIWNLRGQAAQALGHVKNAETYYRRALALASRDISALHNLAISLRLQDNYEDALHSIDQALAAGAASPDTATLRAHLLADLGRFQDAIAAYQAILLSNPGHLDAHEELSRLLPTLGQKQSALTRYEAALVTHPDNLALRLSALRAAKDLGNYENMRAWASKGLEFFPADFELRLADAAADMFTQYDTRAIEKLTALNATHPNEAAPHLYLAHLFVRLGILTDAEFHALRATVLAPNDQTGWALLSVIWRLTNDPREAWLADYDNLVMVLDIEAPPAHPSFFTDLKAALETIHIAKQNPAEQSLRGGTQTRGTLFNRNIPIVQALAAQIEHQINARLTALPHDPAHPFLRHAGSKIRFAGSWSAQLQSAGFHINHIHPMGWLSSAFYVSLPDEVIDGEKSDDHLPLGALAFGMPDSSLNLTLSPRRVEIPAIGKLVIFPSYFWHGTVPFKSTTPRLTVAFDAVPK